MQKIDLRKPLTPKTMGDLMMYLESRPLGEVYSLFQDIVSQLAVKDANGTISDDIRPSATVAGGGNPDGGSDCFPLIPFE